MNASSAISKISEAATIAALLRRKRRHASAQNPRAAPCGNADAIA
jgi:hypothetical protein